MPKVEIHVGGDRDHADLTQRVFRVPGIENMDPAIVKDYLRATVPALGKLEFAVEGDQVTVQASHQNEFVEGSYPMPDGRAVDRQTAIEHALGSLPVAAEVMA